MKIEIEFEDLGNCTKTTCSVPNALTVEEIDRAIEMLHEQREERLEKEATA